jgi:hypothetical protein
MTPRHTQLRSASKEGTDKGEFSVWPPMRHAEEQRVCFPNKGTPRPLKYGGQVPHESRAVC